MTKGWFIWSALTCHRFDRTRHVASIESGDTSPHSKNHSMTHWPHAPKHWLFEPGTYMVTAATFHKAHYFPGSERLDFLMDKLFECAREFGWILEAWSVFPNHYHFVARCPQEPATLKRLIGKLHMQSAKEANRLDGTRGRRVWYQFWDSHITYQASYLARLAYVHQNPVKHGLVADAREYRWCSARWFEDAAPRPFVQTVNSFKTDRVNVVDDF